MRIKKAGVFSLAITLIFLGVLIIVSNIYGFNLIDYFKIIFSIILIILGFEIIILRLWVERKKDDNVEIKIDGKSIFFLIAIFMVTFFILSMDLVFNALNNIDISGLPYIKFR
jgi:hypothetical protein